MNNESPIRIEVNLKDEHSVVYIPPTTEVEKENKKVDPPKDRFTYEEIDYNRRNCLLIHHSGFLTVVKKGDIYYYICPFDYAVLFKGVNGKFTITLEGREYWYSRECSPVGCDHYRWFIYRREDVLKYLDKFMRYSIAVLLAPEIVFVLDRRKEGFPAPFTH